MTDPPALGGRIASTSGSPPGDKSVASPDTADYCGELRHVGAGTVRSGDAELPTITPRDDAGYLTSWFSYSFQSSATVGLTKNNASKISPSLVLNQKSGLSALGGLRSCPSSSCAPRSGLCFPRRCVHPKISARRADK